ncbi:MAG: hypothetical protein AB7U44_01145 [Sulfuricurvum sp.]|uniref:hypothetical protein n=1 Tax=Sulfuricurvum sp. TaxID=2025608 RepID=UPI002628DFA4|nr:hypothetical protein [Sulfuricurvum sp.]MDD2837424.1 hypothetical protein [Sulfuricurvum sp.]MDD3596105.1 hypothetical protein [Sulfuricurvum sp.]MDD4884369.1 hypothetical protein [Sulfuricurvum sp.]
MDSISSTSGMGPEIYAMKKAMETQGEGVMKLLESAGAASASSNSVSGSAVTGIGQTLDIRA